MGVFYKLGKENDLKELSLANLTISAVHHSHPTLVVIYVHMGSYKLVYALTNYKVTAKI